jgi:sigma-B regulation protein RsbU (phosphoserine phosphatase)
MDSFREFGSIIGSMIGTIAVMQILALLLQWGKQSAEKKNINSPLFSILCYGVSGGLFGIYATLSGVSMPNGALVSVRDVGPMMAGCIGGPYAGLIAGLIAGIHRLTYGLPDIVLGTTIPCSISTLLIGIICGFIMRKLIKVKQRWLWASLIAVLMELLHLTLVFIYITFRRGLPASIELIIEILPAFLLANALAFGLLIYLLDRIDRYMNTEQHEKQIESELNVATNIQTGMLPAIFPDYPGKKEFNIGASMVPAKEIGGDFYDFFFIDEDHFAFLIADVSGKGVPAALFMVVAKTLLKNDLCSDLSPSEAVQKANVQLCEGNDSNMFVTTWLGVLEISSGKLVYVNAGHNPPVIKRGEDDFDYLRDLSGFILAGRKKSKYREFTTYLFDGDRILLYTDGITEAMNLSNEQYGEKRLLACIRSDDERTKAGQIIEDVRTDVKKFTGEAEQSDDMTMLAVRISGKFDKITVQSNTANFDIISEFMSSKLKEQGYKGDIINKMNIVLDELYSNIVNYSNSSNLTFGVSTYTNHITLQLEYGGVLYDITQAPKPDITLSAKDRPIGGLGLFIVSKIMDKVVYQEVKGKNRITLLKKTAVEQVETDTAVKNIVPAVTAKE